MTPVCFKLIGIDALIIITAHHHLTLFKYACHNSMKFVVHSLCCPLSRLQCICKLARYSQGNFVLVTGKVREMSGNFI